MSHKNYGKHLQSYLKQNKVLIGLYISNQVFFASAWLLYHNDEFRLVIYPLIVSMVAAMVFLAWRFIIYYRKMTGIQRVYTYIIHNDKGLESLDIEVEKNEEKKLLEIGQTLLDKIKESKTKNYIKEADRESYYALWSHQIKTPITALKLLLENEDKHINQETNRYQMFEELLKIEQYMEMVLHYNRIGDMSKDMVIEEIELKKILHQVLKKFSILFINRQLQLIVDVPEVTVISDKKWIALVIEQVLSNAIKYTQSGRIQIQGVQDKQKVCLIIEDTGIGIRPEDIERVFEKGFTGYNGRLDQRASGIGLYLVKKVMDHLKHLITVESQVGQGTKVTMTFGNLTKM